MNLTRMRVMDHVEIVLDIYRVYKDVLAYCDQDIFNVEFSFYPGRPALF